MFVYKLQQQTHQSWKKNNCIKTIFFVSARVVTSCNHNLCALLSAEKEGDDGIGNDDVITSSGSHWQSPWVSYGAKVTSHQYMNTASKLTHLEVCAPPGGDVEDLDAGDDGEEWRQ